MKIRELLKNIKGIFKPPKKRFYFGKLAYGTPYFYPINFSSSIISIRKLKLNTEEEYLKLNKERPWLKERNLYTNLPLSRRSKNWIVKFSKYHFWIEIGFPIMIKHVKLGWKWKFDSIRYECSPSFQIYFFNWQFVIIWEAPDGNSDLYYEMILWWLNGSNKDLQKAIKTWGWTNYETKKSTWNDDYLEVSSNIRKQRKIKIEKLNNYGE